MTARELEQRRQLLCGQVVLQRLELQGHLRVLRAQESLSVGGRVLRAVKLAAQLLEIGRLACKLAAAFRSK